MKNIYDDKDMLKDAAPAPSAPAAADNSAAAPVQVPYGQPVYMQPPYGQPVYYVPMGQPGFPMQQVPLTQEQLNLIMQQYSAQPYAPVQQPEPQPGAVDSGMRVLYQSADFDRPAELPEEEYEEYEQEPEETVTVTGTSEAVKSVTRKPLTEENIEIEEETITLPHRPAVQKKKSSLRIEEMEMSTYELNSILTRQGRGTPHSYRRQPTEKTNDIPLNFGGTFDIEDTADEVMTDINSHIEEPAQKEKKSKKKLSTFEIVRRTVLGVALAAIVISASMLLNEYRLSKENDKLEEGISDLILTDAATEPTEKDDTATTKKNKKDKDKTTTAALTPEQQWAEIQKEFPSVIFPMGLQLKYARLYATNQDFVGYLEAKGINMSLPIVQGKNDSVYLEKNFYGKKTKYGCPFVTHVNNIVDLDQNTIIFGHHMNNGTVFGALDEYKSIEGFKAAPVITFNTLYQDYSWKVVAAFVTNAYEKDDNGYLFRYYFASLSTQDRFAAYLNEMSQRSLYDTGVDVLPTDKLLTLSTCSHEFDDARFVVVARLVRPGESTDVDVSKATVNPSPRYPQAYYSKKKLKNPYVNASRWEVG